MQLPNLVHTISPASVFVDSILRPCFFGRGREKTPNRMFLPIRGFHDLGQSRSLGPPDQFQDLCAFALGARRASFFSLDGFGLLAVAPFFGAAALAPFLD